MGKLKEWLVNTFAGIGSVIWTVISLLFLVLPVFYLPVSIWIKALIIVAIYFLPLGNLIGQAIVYIWAFVVTVSGPQDVLAIIFYVFFALWLYTTAYPMLCSLFSKHS